MAALQQLVRNAVMHRTYESTNAPVHVYWFDDRIEIVSPGGPYGIVTRETFGKVGLVDYRNPNLAEALRVLGFVQRFGFGIPTARRELERNGNSPLAFDVSANSVLFQGECKAMSRPVLTFFNNKGGVGKTSLVYHVSWMLADMGYRVLACDLDPQANLTAAFLDEDQLEDLWLAGGTDVPTTIYRSIQLVDSPSATSESPNFSS